jgi:prepilin-type N-terminal cleavage/methylation domain-containing protein
MKNNKGFSLVELIIVIAIMAILVGVMAPQLIKYIEKSKVSADTQAADSVHTAVLTAMMDPEIVNVSSYNSEFKNMQTAGSVANLSTASGTIGSAALEILGATNGSEVTGSLKSTGATDVQFVIVGNNKVSVWVPGSDSRGSKSGSPYIVVE